MAKTRKSFSVEQKLQIIQEQLRWGIILIACITACKTSPSSDKQYTDTKEDRIYRLKLNPQLGENYKFDTKNESIMKLEVDDKKINNVNRTSLIASYILTKDSAGDFRMNMSYDKIHLYSKNGDKETDADASSDPNSGSALDHMLSVLKSSTLEAEISPLGVVKSIKGYKELGAKLVSYVNPSGYETKEIAQEQWDKTVGNGVIKKNMADLFSFFPDSAIRIGDKWKLESKQNGELPVDVVTTYRLAEINDGIAKIYVKAVITSEHGSFSYSGIDVTADLKGDQEGEYDMDIKTGMLKHGESSSSISGNLEMMGKDIPIDIKDNVTINRIE